MTNSLSIFTNGMTRIPPDKLTERQINLLEYLDSLENFEIYIKPFACSTYENCSVLPILKKCKNLKVIDNVNLLQFLQKYNPKSVLIEYPSQPLFDVLHLDTQIFLMDDFVHPFEKKALEELQRRVYYSENIEEVISKINLFLAGKLKKKRDDTFYKHYIHKENTEENTLKFIDKSVTPITMK